jgi:radical SAM superfamily enzyme YgiQ (UPF0313 family)
MKVKMILPALTEARTPFYRPIKYSLFPPLGLATLAGYLDPDDQVVIEDEHVAPLELGDRPDLVVIQVYITSARRAYQLADHYRARGAHVCLGGLHVTALPDEAAGHADTIFLGPGEATWPAFLADWRQGRPGRCYQSAIRSLDDLPPVRRDLIARHRYLVPNSIVVSRGCPHCCDFCYKESFFRGGRSFYTRRVDAVLAEIERLPGRHLFFLDDNLFADRAYAAALFDGLAGMGRVWQAAATVSALADHALLDRAAASGLRSLFIGFETLNQDNLREQHKHQNLRHSYDGVVHSLHQRGVMINASFVFGMDHDDDTVFDRTVDWAIAAGIETATFHILTPYPGTVLYDRLRRQGRILSQDWDLYDTRHCVFEPSQMAPAVLEAGYWRCYERFYQWRSIMQAAASKGSLLGMLRHLAYSGGWKKLEPVWGAIIKSGLLGLTRPLLEGVLSGRGPRELPRSHRRGRGEGGGSVREGGNGNAAGGPVGRGYSSRRQESRDSSLTSRYLPVRASGAQTGLSESLLRPSTVSLAGSAAITTSSPSLLVTSKRSPARMIEAYLPKLSSELQITLPSATDRHTSEPLPRCDRPNR